MPLSEQLSRWQAAGLMDAQQAARIADFESRQDLHDTPPHGLEITATEVIAYAGAVVVLVGVSFLVGTQYQQLGTAGRLAIFALVAGAGLGVGFFMEGRSERPPARRAVAAGFTLACIAVLAFGSEAAMDAGWLAKSSGDQSGAWMIGGLAAAVLAAAVLRRTGNAMVALALAFCLYVAVAGLDAWVGGNNARLGELTWLVPGVALAGGAEVLRRRPSSWAAEVLRFAALAPPAVAALVLSEGVHDDALEAFAGLLAALGFVAAVQRGSGGYAIAAGLALFIVVVEVGIRHFGQTLGFPIVLIISGLVLLAIAAGLVRLLPRLRPAGASPSSLRRR